MNLKSELSRLVRTFEEESNEAFNLWSWLPSEEAAAKTHGSYASEYMPSTADVMREATLVLSILRGFEARKEAVEDHFRCQCGEDDECLQETFEQIAARFKAKFGVEIKL